MVYFTSDTHFNHKNIIKYCDRPFENVGDMNEQLIAKWNEVVQDGDVVYHLGDFALGRQEYDIDKIVKRLNGEIRLIRGNHDRWSVGFYEDVGLIVLKNPPIELPDFKVILSHVPIPDKQIPEGYINVHGHIHDKHLYECIESYSPNLYTVDKHLNVSCDVTDFKPIKADDFEDLLKKQNEKIVK